MLLRTLCKGLVSSVLGLVLATSCTKSGTGDSPAGGNAASKANSAKSDIKIGLVFDKGGKDDKSFNSAAFRGAKEAQKDLGFDLKDVETSDDAAFEPALRTFAERGYPLVIAVGFAQLDAVKKVAPQFPKTHFAIIDAIAEGPNVAALMFAEHEGSFLVGALAAMMSKTGKVGFVGGMETPLIRRFEMGYEAGVKSVNPKAEIKVNYVGINSAAWANPSRGKELALGQYGSGVDVIFHAAGASGIGVFDAAEEKKTFVIGVDSNQNAIKPGRVATSMLKRVDTAVYEVIKQELAGSFKAGTQSFGLKDKGIDYAVDENNKSIIEPYTAKLEAIKEKIVKGEIKVPDYYEVSKKK